MKKCNKTHLRGAFTLVLSLAMVMGILAGTGMEARAEEGFTTVGLDLSDSGLFWDTVSTGCDGFTADDKSHIEAWLRTLGTSKDTVYIVCIAHSSEASYYYAWSGGNWLQFQDEGKDTQRNTIGTGDDLKGYSSVYAVKRGSTPSTPSTTSESQSGASHTHSYSWVTVQVVTAEQDGIEEYRCSCGDVQARSIIPANMVFVKGLYGAIKDAPQGGTATFDSGRLYTISDYVIRKLAERPDVTTVIIFEYQNQKYKMTIPAGVDYTSLLADEDYFYGYFYFANAVGATIEVL